MRRVVGILCVFAFCTGVAYADVCEVVLNKALREYDIQTDSSSYLNSMHQKYCSQSGTTSSSGTNVGLDAVVKAIPVKFTLGASDARTAMTNFCKEYNSSATASNDSYRYKETIVDRALQSFDNCVALSTAGILVSHDIVSTGETQIYLRAGVGKPVILRGISTSSNVNCTGTDGRKMINYKENVGIRTDTSTTINCHREPVVDSGGNKIYGEGTIALDVELGKYSVFLPRDTKLAEDQASKIAVTIGELQNRIDSLEKRRLTCKVAEAVSRNSRSPAVAAVVPAADREGAFVTGGGCEVPGGPGAFPHNPPIIASRPSGLTWNCGGADPPNIPLSFVVKAHVIYCKFSP